MWRVINSFRMFPCQLPPSVSVLFLKYSEENERSQNIACMSAYIDITAVHNLEVDGTVGFLRLATDRWTVVRCCSACIQHALVTLDIPLKRAGTCKLVL